MTVPYQIQEFRKYLKELRNKQDKLYHLKKETKCFYTYIEVRQEIKKNHYWIKRFEKQIYALLA